MGVRRLMARVSITFMDDARSIAALHVEPSFFGRLLGRETVTDFVCAAAAPGGGRCWIHDSTGRSVRSSRLVSAIERARSALPRVDSRMAT
jgi:hypothetical protein